MNQEKNLSGAVIVFILILSLTACRTDNEKMPIMNSDVSSPPIASVSESIVSLSPTPILPSNWLVQSTSPSDVPNPPVPYTTPSASAEPVSGWETDPKVGFWYDDEEIQELYARNNLKVTEIRDGAGITIVQTDETEICPDSYLFTKFDRRTGNRVPISLCVSAVDFEISEYSYVYILDKGGEEISTPYRNFPALYCVTFSEREGVETSNIYKEQYYMPVERSFSVGYSGIHLAVNKIQIIGYELYIEYGEPSEGYVFAGGGPRVPRSNISFSDGFCTIAMEDTEVSQQLKIVENDADPSISLVSIDQNAEDTVVKLKLNKSELCRYNFREDSNPITLMPYSIISFKRHDPYKYTDRW
jgi:hypothetical protein